MTEQDDETPDQPPESEDTPHFLDRDVGGRPMIVYLALLAGAFVLLILLLIVWVSSRDGGGNEPPVCLGIDLEEAEQVVLAGNVDRIDVVVDSDDPLAGLTAIQLELNDDECRALPEGADNRSDLYTLLGIVSLFNEEGDDSIRVEYRRLTVPPELLSTSTPTPTITPIPSETPIPTETPTLVPTAEPTTTPVVSVEASPDSTPTAAPASPSPASEPSPKSTPLGYPVATPADGSRDAN